MIHQDTTAFKEWHGSYVAKDRAEAFAQALDYLASTKSTDFVDSVSISKWNYD